MGAWGSKPAAKKPVRKHAPSQQDRAILDLKASRDRLRKAQARMEGETGRLTTQAQALVQAGKKDRALLCLKLRRFKEAKIAELDQQLLTLEEVVQSIEWETETLKVFQALKEGNKALDDIHSVMSVDKVEQLMDETREAIEYQQEVSDLLSGGAVDLDEAAIDAELEQLESEILGTGAGVAAGTPATDMPQVPTTPVMPVAPTGPVAVPEEQQAAEPVPEPMMA